MEQIQLQHTGLKVSRVCLGTMNFQSQVDEQESLRIVDCCLDAGVDFIDTANLYNNGCAEQFDWEGIAWQTPAGRSAPVILIQCEC